ncbi:MAG: DEAD-box ATP-dependent RNA helicase CshB [Tenericutes bacterium ADurb.Bin087]|nr:MAG: DEAD-box ATP-dependent RNA helicase CshB [Tenericutes bacterium ADurb.Bin087]
MEFGKYNIDKKLVEALKKHGYLTMTPVQSEILPRALKGESLIVKAKTGSGKTHSYLIPILNKLEKSDEIQALILAPTRELARQIYDFARTLNNDYKEVDILFLAGGLQTSRHKERLATKPALIIATPGRLKALLINEDITSFKSIHTVVLDEGDMLLDSGFYGVISETLAALDNPTVQLFSATIPQKLANLVTLKTGVKSIIDIDKSDKTSENVTHYLIDVHHQNRFEVVENFIKHFNPYLLLVFCSTNKEVLELYQYLSAKGHKIGLLTGELESRKRKAMFRRVRNNEFQVVVASDIAARGIDIDDVSDVLSVSFPFDLEFYFHRAGRTGRLDNKGNAYTLYDHDDLDTIEKVEKLGVHFTRLAYKSGTFSNAPKRMSRPKAQSADEKELDVKIKTAVAQTRTKKVRPGYKKKVKTAVERVKKAHRRKMIKKSIREQRVERYKAQKGGSHE